MCRLSPKILDEAIRTVDQMDLHQKEKLSNEIYEQQPNFLASVLVHSRMGSPVERIDRVLHLLLLAYQAVEIAGADRRFITEEDAHNLDRWVGHIKFLEGPDDHSNSAALEQYIADHPEKYLLAYAHEQLLTAGIHHMDHENDKNLVFLFLASQQQPHQTCT